MISSLFSGAKLALLHSDGSECDDAFYYHHDVHFTEDGTNDRLIQFGPWSARSPRKITHWALLDAQDNTLDAGELRSEYVMRRGDRLTFQRASIKVAIVGDVLGITAVFMPSGFVVGVPPVVSAPESPPASSFEYPEQETLPPFWLRKRVWGKAPLPPEQAQGMSDVGFSLVYGWQQRLARPNTWLAEIIKRKQQDLIIAGVI